MAKITPWHSLKESVHHDTTRCRAGNRIEMQDLQLGSGDKPLCPECAALDALEAQGPAVAQNTAMSSGWESWFKRVD